MNRKYTLTLFLRWKVTDGGLGQKTDWRMYLNNYLQGRYGHTRLLSWSNSQSGPSHDTRWLAVAYCKSADRCFLTQALTNGFVYKLTALSMGGVWPATGDLPWKSQPKPPITPWHLITNNLSYVKMQLHWTALQIGP